MSTDRRDVARLRPLALSLVVALAGFSLAGCRQDMHDQPRYEPLEASAFFDDGKASRDFVEGTVARGQLREDTVFYTGLTGGSGSWVSALPMTADRALLERGRERYDIFCSPCHGRLGEGDGMVVQRGFKRPPSFHVDPLRSQPVGYYFDVITNGFGQMSGYASMVPAHDRWAIAAYIRALQLSQGAPLDGLEAADREAIAAAVAAAAAPAPAEPASGGSHSEADGH